MAVEISGGSRICGSGMGRDGDEDEDDDVEAEAAVRLKRAGRTGGKYRWKKIVCRTPV